MLNHTTPPAPSPEQLEALSLLLQQHKAYEAERRTNRRMLWVCVFVALVVLLIALGSPL